jgi:hypothetical protein
MIDVLAAGALAMVFTLLLFRLWGGILAAQETALYRIQAVNDASLLVDSFRDTSPAAARLRLDPARLRGICGIGQGEKWDPRGFRYRELDFILLGHPCHARTRPGK